MATSNFDDPFQLLSKIGHEWTLEKINDSLRFVELLLFSDEAIFHLEGGINRKNSSYWASENPH